MPRVCRFHGSCAPPRHRSHPVACGTVVVQELLHPSLRMANAHVCCGNARAAKTWITMYNVGRTVPQSGRGSYSGPCRTFGPNFRSRRPGFRSGLSVGEPPAPPWFRPRPTVLCGESSVRRSGKAPGFRPKPRSTTGVSARNPGRTTGVSARNPGPLTGISAEIPVIGPGFPPKSRS